MGNGLCGTPPQRDRVAGVFTRLDGGGYSWAVLWLLRIHLGLLQVVLVALGNHSDLHLVEVQRVRVL